MKRENTTRYAVLGLLSITSCSGYDLKKMADMSISHFWSENYGHIYPVLHALEAEGMVEKEPQQTPMTPGRPPKSVYRITEKGAKELNAWLQRPVDYHPFRNELLLKIFLAKDVPVSTVKETLARERELQARKLESLRGIEAMLKNTEPYRSQKALPLWLATIDFGKRFTKMAMEWSEDTARALEGRASAS